VSSRRTRRVWTVANGLVLLAVSAWVVGVSIDPSPPHRTISQADLLIKQIGPRESLAPSERPVPQKAEFLTPKAPHFGVSYPEAPLGAKSLAAITAKAGTAPTLIEFFVKWTEEFRPETVAACYKAGALPVVGWEPWAGESFGGSQPKYALAKIIGGEFDPYITRFALAVRDNRLPIVLRFAHEMNGKWYPWSERRSGNSLGEYVQAWRHVHDVFARLGATNVIWVWSPNIIRPVPSVKLPPLYPGDAYVDWVGLVGYAVKEATPGEVFDETYTVLRSFTKKPLLITETGVQPGPHQALWTRGLFRWLAQHKDVVGFVWFEYDRTGATSDWRFSRSPRTLAAFREGLTATTLAPAVHP
jgi:hypothetical protein